MRRARTFALAADLEQPPPVLQMRGNGAAAEQDDAVLVEIVVRTRGAEPLEIVRRRISVRMYREQLALYQVGLGWLAQANGNVGLAHRQIQLFIRRDQRDVDVRIKVEELAEPRRKPVHADARRGRHLELAIGPLAAVRELGARRFELHEDFVGRAVEQLALLSEDQPAGVAVKQ